ncbi:hypothetical protein SERLA73DRAFT_71779 [Serpula lacrymans var. lacrymans S7.3]|uniref:Uncharacterized protein n=2 Tax=Serpula lacrymans var. lacrymans TaxID=341189 RepID=F8PSV2_SERL3|nr:uncharacterized protein SERLADRAFT_436183 [Serpula lacrymans var. lacrymans S7.9]EGO00810.1 hypothetical protein SERLA73DRAFT_71779 [Serpula lacrymans var. lacrymans S7.3]EGO26369.1 hypothetical protein SERLADRAFT_436183 [Serpula lacrymans var. lacrymans S7.9]
MAGQIQLKVPPPSRSGLYRRCAIPPKPLNLRERVEIRVARRARRASATLLMIPPQRTVDQVARTFLAYHGTSKAESDKAVHRP